ncbi:MAG: hypothetical protein ACLFPV_13515 [Spirochaetaceae bacterium]
MTRIGLGPLLVLILIIPITAVVPVDGSEASLEVLQAYLPQAGTETDESLERVLSSAMAVRLARLGPLDADTPPPPGRIQDRATLLELAADRRSELLLLGRYRVDDQRVVVQFELFDVSDGSLMAATEAGRDIDLLLDRLGDTAAAELYQQASSGIAELIAAQPPPPAEPPVERPTDEPLPTEADLARSRGSLETSVAVAVAVPLGDFGTFFAFGIGAEPALHYRFERAAIGLRSGVTRFRPERTDTGEYVRTLVPVMADAWVTLGQTGNLAWFAGAAAGVAMRIDDGSTVSDRLAPALPAWRTGIGTRIPLADRWLLTPALTLNGVLHLYREQDGDSVETEHILWLAPTLSVVRKM